MTTKEKILEKFSEQNGSIISGQKLAEECNVSRTAIWKAINSLREDGIQIEGTTNGGYRLLDTDIFSENNFHQIFEKTFSEFNSCHLECFKEIDSTNTYAKRILAECGNLRLADGELSESGKKYHQAIIVAEHQTAGRGRLGRTFVSPEKTGIYLSIIYAPKGGITNPAGITACSAVAICRAINSLYNINPQIKWINDIFIDGKKVCGILAEGVTNFETGVIESAIIGIGINLRTNKKDFDSELTKIAGSLEDALKKRNETENEIFLNRCNLASEIAGQVLRILNEDSMSKNSHKKIMDEYRKLSFLTGKEITVFPLIGEKKSSYKAVVKDVDDNAGLVISLPDGSSRTLNSGEVSLRTKNVEASKNINS